MAATQGQVGYQSKAYRGATQIIECKGIEPSEPVFDEAEFTHLESLGRTKEFRPTMKDPGEVTLTFNRVLSDGVQNAIEDDYHDGVTDLETWKYEICHNVTAAVLRTYTFTAYIRTCVTAPVNTSDPIEFRVTLRISGAITIT
ncbi:MAG: hypothetical protein A2V88_15980 [Elusimicrobia bacterium RBG_16_66_12]|nr:MAG: hypothetical protein A2V88_15980 [Elusimicrobia bacterium RBG_16_66_12]